MKFKKGLSLMLLALGMVGVAACDSDETTSDDQNNTGDTSGDNNGGGDNTGTVDLTSNKTTAKAELDTYAQTKLTQQSKNDDGTVAAAVTAGKAAIDEANSEESINLAVTNAKQAIDAAVAALPEELAMTTVYMVGDSTVCSFKDAYYYPRYGYGTQMYNYFNSSLTVFNNLASSGKSSKSFPVDDASKGNYDTLTQNIKKGDFLIIGFGHNDEKSDDVSRFTDPTKPVTDNTSFKYHLYESYIKVAKEKGATPILCTPVVRASDKDDYTGSKAHITDDGDYAQAIRDLGTETGTTVIDLTAKTKELYEDLGYAEAKYFHAFTAGKFDEDGETVILDERTIDETHLNIYGAKQVAYLFASELKKTDNKLSKYLLDTLTAPSKENDLVKNSSYVYKPYSVPDFEAYEELLANGRDKESVEDDGSISVSHKTYANFTTITDGWYGTAFGETGANEVYAESSAGYIAKEITDGVFNVGQTGASSKGKLSSKTDGLAMVFRQVEKSKNFKITASAKVLTVANTNQAGFGLMLRDDIYLDQTVQDKTINSNYLSAGFITAEDSSTGNLISNIIFGRENTKIFKESNKIDSLYAVDDTATFEIERIGQTVNLKVVYKDQTYTASKVDFDLFSRDFDYMYVGMFATRGTTVEFTNVTFEITGDAIQA